jgi:hypothetical protein
MPEPLDVVDLSAPGPEETAQRLAALRWRMNLLVALAALVGFGAFATVLVVAKTRALYGEHYAFRAGVRPGMTEAEVRQRFGEPYRVYWVPEVLKPVLEGRGRYQRFSPDVTRPGVVPPRYARALHYRTTLEHGEFVFLDEAGKVLAVVTGRPGQARSMPLPGQAPAGNAAEPAEPDTGASAEQEFGSD